MMELLGLQKEVVDFLMTHKPPFEIESIYRKFKDMSTHETKTMLRYLNALKISSVDDFTFDVIQIWVNEEAK